MRGRAGFTLIELLIVVAIIGLLAAIAAVNYALAQVRARVSESKAEMKGLETALEWYRSDEGEFPAGTYGEVVPGSSIYNLRLRVLTTPIAYLSELPMDPFNLGDPTQYDEYSAALPGRTTYDYNTTEALIAIWTGLGTSVELAREQWLKYYGQSEWKLVGVGPNHKFKPDDWGGVKYDPTNGIRSAGDIVLTQAIRFQD